MAKGERSDLPRVTFPVAVLWLVVALGLLGTGAVFWGLSRVEADLETRAEAALAGAGFDVAVAMEGRDAALRGEVIDEARRSEAARLVAGLRGMRDVDAAGLVVVGEPPAPPAPAVPVAPEIVVEVTSGSAVVQGRLRDAANADAVVAAAATAFGPADVENRIVVDPAAGPAPWLADFVVALAALRDVDDGSIVGSEAGITVSGVIPTLEARDALDDVLAGLGETSENLLTIGVLPNPTLTAARDPASGRVTIGGVVPAEGVVTAVLGRAVAVHGANAVEGSLTVDRVDDPPYLARLPALFDAARDLDAWTADLADGVLRVEGRAPGDLELRLAAEALADLEGDGLDVTLDLELSAAAVAADLTALFTAAEVFVEGTATLTSHGAAVVEAAARVLAANPSARLVVEGHTDDRGDTAANLELSEARAQEVVVRLVTAGVEAQRLTAVGFGEAEPIASNATEEGRTANRRIAFTPRDEES
jgi:OOP family OmpA-OmpF porin